MEQFLNELIKSGKIATITLKSDQTLNVKAVDDNIYTLTNGQTMYIAPDQIATIIDGTPDERLGF